MKLNTKKLKPWLNKFWDNPPACMICKNEDWALLERICELTEYNLNSSQGILTVPIVVFACSNCGYIISFSAIALGVVEKQETDNLT